MGPRHFPSVEILLICELLSGQLRVTLFLSSFPCPLLCRRHCETQKPDTFIAAIGGSMQFTIEHTAGIGSKRKAFRAGPRMERTSDLRPATSPFPLRAACLARAASDLRTFSGTENC
jgi:hypothetical protein